MRLGSVTPVKYMLGSAAVQRIYVGANQVWSAATYDTDAAAYIAAVEFADGEALEPAVKAAYDAFIVGIKADACVTTLANHPIKAACIMAGARTLAGALVPLVGPAPTNAGGLFVSGDYERKTGLAGDGTTKYLNSNRNNNDDPQNSKHLAAWVSEQPDPTGSGNFWYIRSALGVGNSILGRSGTTARRLVARINADTSTVITDWKAVPGFAGSSRPNSSSIQTRVAGSTATHGVSSQVPLNDDLGVFGPAGLVAGNHRMAFYSIGEALNLALLDARLATLMSDINAAIP